MPTYPVVCHECEIHTDVVAPSSQCDNLHCPECGGKVEQDWEAKVSTLAIGDGAKTLSGKGSVSRKWAFHPNEVQEAQQLAARFGSNDLANCIDPEHGEVKFKNRAQARKFNTAMDKVRKHYAEKGE